MRQLSIHTISLIGPEDEVRPRHPATGPDPFVVRGAGTTDHYNDFRSWTTDLRRGEEWVWSQTLVHWGPDGWVETTPRVVIALDQGFLRWLADRPAATAVWRDIRQARMCRPVGAVDLQAVALADGWAGGAAGRLTLADKMDDLGLTRVALFYRRDANRRAEAEWRSAARLYGAGMAVAQQILGVPVCDMDPGRGLVYVAVADDHPARLRGRNPVVRESRTVARWGKTCRRLVLRDDLWNRVVAAIQAERAKPFVPPWRDEEAG